MFFLCFLLLGPVNGGFIQRTELDRYSRIANSTDGYPCLSGCSPTTNECVINWLWIKKPCRTENEPAPIFYTARVKDKSSGICLSNCGYFGHLYEWCITTADNKWDYCSSKQRREEPTPTGKSIVDSYTKDRQLCQNDCLNKNNKGYWCKINSLFSNVCAKQAISRIPILPSDYKIGDSSKHNCDAFLTNLVRESFRANVSYYDSEVVPDNYLEEVANTVEAAVKLAPESGLFKDVSEPGSAVQNYTMTNMYLANGTSVLVPAVIRAVVSNSTIRRNQPLIDLRIMDERNRQRRRRHLNSDKIGYFNWRIIAYELGGSDEDYNFIRQSPNFYESWLHLQRAMAKWCGESGGSVDILAVVFYEDTRTVLPKALGAAFTFHNPDGSVFVCCKDTIYWNK